MSVKVNNYWCSLNDIAYHPILKKAKDWMIFYDKPDVLFLTSSGGDLAVSFSIILAFTRLLKEGVEINGMQQFVHEKPFIIDDISIRPSNIS